MTLVQHHHGPDDSQGVAERIFYHREHILIGGEIWRAVERGLVRLLLALGRKEAMHVAPVLKHLQRYLDFSRFED